MSDQVVERDAIARPAARKSARSGKRLALPGTALAIGLGVAWYGYDWWTAGRFIETTDDAYVGGNVTTIAPHVTGFVDAILVTDNEHVTAGQLLLKASAAFLLALGRPSERASMKHADLEMVRQGREWPRGARARQTREGSPPRRET